MEKQQLKKLHYQVRYPVYAWFALDAEALRSRVQSVYANRNPLALHEMRNDWATVHRPQIPLTPMQTTPSVSQIQRSIFPFYPKFHLAPLPHNPPLYGSRSCCVFPFFRTLIENTENYNIHNTIKFVIQSILYFEKKKILVHLFTHQ